VVSGGAGKKIMDEIRILIADKDRLEQASLHSRAAEAEYMSQRTKIVILGGSGIGLFVVALIGWYIASSLGRRIDSAAQRIQSSPSELRTAANQQATVSRENSAGGAPHAGPTSGNPAG
jgi:hypothetical protein